MIRFFGKKLLAFLFTSIFALMLSSCSPEQDEIIGKWETKVPHTVLASASDPVLEPYMQYADFSNVYKRQVYEFDENGFYKITVYVDEYVKAYKAAVYEGIKVYYANEIERNNLDYTVDELLERDGITIDSVTLDEKSMNQLKKEQYSEGNYTVVQGKLYRSSSKEYDVDKSIYIEYEIKNGNLIFKKQVGGNIMMTSKIFPLTFEKID